MSSLIVEVVQIDNVEKHPNADRLDLLQVKGWNVVAAKGQYGKGDACVYVPIDSVLPEKLESFLFPPDSKVKLSKSRVKTIKLRGAFSQGMCIALTDELFKLYPALEKAKVGEDVAATLGITKYEPPAPSYQSNPNRKGKAPRNNPNFTKYTDIENFKHYPNLFNSETLVYVTEKLHGTSARYGVFPTHAGTIWKKILKFFHLLPKHEFCYGSRNLQLQAPGNKGKIYYSSDVYGKIAKQEDIAAKLLPGEAIYGEIVGDGIQKNYSYGCKAGEHKFFAYDVQVDGRWLDPVDFRAFCKERGFEPVPMLYLGLWDKEIADKLRQGDSEVGGQKIREGVVIKPATETFNPMFGRVVAKFINDEYLLKDNTEWH